MQKTSSSCVYVDIKSSLVFRVISCCFYVKANFSNFCSPANLLASKANRVKEELGDSCVCSALTSSGGLGPGSAVFRLDGSLIHPWSLISESKDAVCCD